MHGRIETYVHSDTTTPNKGAATVRVSCKSEAGSRTDIFKDFCKKAAQLCYGASSENWDEVLFHFPGLETTRTDAEEKLKEPIKVEDISVTTLEAGRYVNVGLAVKVLQKCAKKKKIPEEYAKLLSADIWELLGKKPEEAAE